jgi:hypothetical protein
MTRDEARRIAVTAQSKTCYKSGDPGLWVGPGGTLITRCLVQADGQRRTHGSAIPPEERTAWWLLYPEYADGIAMRGAVARINLDSHPIVFVFTKRDCSPRIASRSAT